MKKCVTVYCGSSSGKDARFGVVAREVGRRLAEAGAEVITGAGATGMMRAVADGALEAGGTVHGIIPRFMVENGWQYDALTQITVTETMHERKQMMAELSTGVIALPGGVGTWEEFMEIVTWKQLGLFCGNIVLLNVEGYYDPIVTMFASGVEKGFLKADHSGLFDVADSAEAAVRMALNPANKRFTSKI